MHLLKTLLFLTLSSVCLTACDLMGVAHRPPTVLTQIQVEPQPVLEASLTCPPKPAPPPKPTAGNTMSKPAASFLADRLAWGEDCEAKLAEAREQLRGPQQP